VGSTEKQGLGFKLDAREKRKRKARKRSAEKKPEGSNSYRTRVLGEKRMGQ